MMCLLKIENSRGSDLSSSRRTMLCTDYEQKGGSCLEEWQAVKERCFLVKCSQMQQVGLWQLKGAPSTNKGDSAPFAS